MQVRDPESVRVALRNGADIEYREGGRCGTALMNAANLGNLEVVKVLVEEGANLEAVDVYGYTALAIACLSNKYQVQGDRIEFIQQGGEKL